MCLNVRCLVVTVCCLFCWLVSFVFSGGGGEGIVVLFCFASFLVLFKCVSAFPADCKTLVQLYRAFVVCWSSQPST